MVAHSVRSQPTRGLVALACAGLVTVGVPVLPAAQAATTQTQAQAQSACAPTLQPLIKDDRSQPAEWKDPSTLEFGLGDAAKSDLPQAVGPVPAGPVWFIGSTQEAGVPWLGANTQNLDLLANTTGEVTYELSGFEGPGAMSVFTDGKLGELVGDVWFTATNGNPDGSHTIPANTHVHPNWVFSKPGTYKVTVKMTATLKSGEKVSGDSTLTFDVGGSGNANEGHFDFGAAVKCGTPQPQGNASEQSDNQPQGDTSGQAPTQAQTKFGAGGRLPDGKEWSVDGEAGIVHRGVPTTPVSKREVVNLAQAQAPAGDKKDAACVGGIKPMVKDDRSQPAEWKDPATLEFGLGDASKADMPQNVGPVPAGPVYMISQTQQAGVPWLGANTQHPALLENTSGEVTYELSGYEGPGALVVFTSGNLGQLVGEEWFRANEGKFQGSHTIPANTHVHPNWVFSKPGTYKVTIKMTTTSKGGDKLTGESTLTFNVGGTGNANEGHFDFGAVYDPQGNCSTGDSAAKDDGAAAAASEGTSGSSGTSGTSGASSAGGSSSEATRDGQLAETGTTVMTLPFAVLGLGILVFGAGMVTLDSRLRKRIFGIVGNAK